MRRPNRFHLAVAAAALVTRIAGCGGGAAADRPDRPLLTVEQEIQLGRALAPYLEDLAGGRLANLPVGVYVRTVGERVARPAPRRGLPYQFTVIDSTEVRALALPGGLVYLTRGLLGSLETESQLAAALAHQLAHISARQVVGALCRECGDAAVLAAVAAAEATAAGTALPRHHQTLARLAKAIHAHACDPDTEMAADRLGLDYLVAAGYHPSGMVGFLKVLAGSARSGDSAALDEDADSRARRIRSIIERKYRDRGGRVADEEYRGEVLNRLTAP